MTKHTLFIAMAGFVELIFVGSTAMATTWHVDDDNCPGPGSGTVADPFCSIQDGIGASSNGDEVLVSQGTYHETINFLGKAITLQSKDGARVTTIDAGGLNNRVVACISGEGPSTILRGFTITGGRAFEGGGMLNVGSSPTVNNCDFFGNVASAPNPAGNGNGGGMYNVNSSPAVINCVFRHNTSRGWGGGGGMCNMESSNPIISNCTFFGNDVRQADSGGGAMLNSSIASPTVTNCVLWENPGNVIYPTTMPIVGPAIVNYSIIQGGWTGSGGIGILNIDPRFSDPDGGDNLAGTRDDNLRLQSGSPCLDAGNNSVVTLLEDLDRRPRMVDDILTVDTGNGTPPIVDIGAYELQEPTVPALSRRGMIATVFLLAAAGTFVIRRRNRGNMGSCASIRNPPRSEVPTWIAVFFYATLSTSSVAQVQVGPQIRIDLNGGTAPASETSIGASQLDSNEIVAAWNDWRSGGYTILLGVGVTQNAGASWSELLVRAPSGHQSSCECDPMTAYDDRTGTLWVGGISADYNGGVFVARKIAGQPTFYPSVMAQLTGQADKGWMAAGPAPGDLNATNVYIAHKLGLLRSTSMGDTWTGPIPIDVGQGFLPRVGPAGELYIAYWDFEDGVMLRRSFDGGQTLGSAIRIATRIDYWTGLPAQFPGQFRVPPLSYLAVDNNDGTLYCVYFDTTDTESGNYNVDLYFTKSTNQGSTWTTPVIMNGDSDPPGDQFFPWLEVDESGNLHVVFLDSRNTNQSDTEPYAMLDAYYAFSKDRGANWEEFRLTPNSFSSANDGGTHAPSEQFIGDYLGLACSKGKVFPCYVSTQNGDPDIYTHLVTILGGCCLTSSCTSLTKEDCATQGGMFLGSAIPCSTIDCESNGMPDECESPRACCLPPPEGGCVVTTESCCDDLEGEYKSNKPACTMNACPQWNGPSGGGDP